MSLRISVSVNRGMLGRLWRLGRRFVRLSSVHRGDESLRVNARFDGGQMAFELRIGVGDTSP